MCVFFMQTIILLMISEIISKLKKKTYLLPQGDEGKYITALPLTDRYASREFRVEPSLGTSQPFSIFENYTNIFLQSRC